MQPILETFSPCSVSWNAAPKRILLLFLHLLTRFRIRASGGISFPCRQGGRWNLETLKTLIAQSANLHMANRQQNPFDSQHGSRKGVSLVPQPQLAPPPRLNVPPTSPSTNMYSSNDDTTSPPVYPPRAIIYRDGSFSSSSTRPPDDVVRPKKSMRGVSFKDSNATNSMELSIVDSYNKRDSGM